MQANRGTDTGPELRLRSELHRRGIRFRKHLPIRIDEKLIRPDVVFTRHRLAVFVDGCFWHGCAEHRSIPESNRDFWREKIERTRARDREQVKALEREGWSVIRVWEHEPIADAAERIGQRLDELKEKQPA